MRYTDSESREIDVHPSVENVSKREKRYMEGNLDISLCLQLRDHINIRGKDNMVMMMMKEEDITKAE